MSDAEWDSVMTMPVETELNTLPQGHAAEDLVRSYSSKQWQQPFDSFQCSVNGTSGRHDVATQREVDLSIAAGRLSKHDRILDLCCGSGRHCLELAQRGFSNLVGLDRSRSRVNQARRRARSAGVDILYREGDARHIPEKPASADAVLLLGGSFGGFIKPGDNLSVLIAIKRVLKARGVLLVDFADDAWLLQNIDQQSWEWLDGSRFICRERSLAADGEMLLSREIHVHRHRGVIADLMEAERLYGPATMIKRLSDAGFEGVSLSGVIAEQDECETGKSRSILRFLVVAHAPAKEFRTI